MKNKNTYSLQLFGDWFLIIFHGLFFKSQMQNVNGSVSIWNKELSLTINYVTKFLLTPTMLSESLGSSSFKKDCRRERTFSASVTCSNYQNRLLSYYHSGDSYPEKEKSYLRIVTKDFYCWCFHLCFPDTLVTLLKYLSIWGWRQFAIIQVTRKTLKNQCTVYSRKKKHVILKFNLNLIFKIFNLPYKPSVPN